MTFTMKTSAIIANMGSTTPYLPHSSVERTKPSIINLRAGYVFHTSPFIMASGAKPIPAAAPRRVVPALISSSSKQQQQGQQCHQHPLKTVMETRAWRPR